MTDDKHNTIKPPQNNSSGIYIKEKKRYYQSTNVQVEVFKITIAYKVFWVAIGAYAFLSLMLFGWDILIYLKTDEIPDFGDHAFKIFGFVGPIVTFVLGNISGRSK